MCPHPASGDPAASRCVSKSQILSHIFARRRGTNARRCSRCSSRCQGGYTDSNLMHSPVRWCGKWHQTAHPHWGENNREYCVCTCHFIILLWAKMWLTEIPSLPFWLVFFGFFFTSDTTSWQLLWNGYCQFVLLQRDYLKTLYMNVKLNFGIFPCLLKSEINRGIKKYLI